MPSVNTNVGALVALQNLNATQAQLQITQNRINTGLKVASAKDDGATWAIAQGQRAQISALDSVKGSLQRGQSAVDVAVNAGTTVSDLLSQMKSKVAAAADTSMDSTARSALNEDFKALRDQISKVVSNADFNGVNLIKSGGTSYGALANANATSTLTVKAEDLSLGGANVSIGATTSFSTATQAQALIATVNTSIDKVSGALARLGTGSNALGTHLNFISKLQDTLTAGVGNLVDADLASESAKLQSLQTKQQLGVQALSIANQSSGILLSLFR